MYGYRWDKQTKKRIPIDYEVKIVQKIFAMLGEGASCFSVAKTLNEQTIPTKGGSKWEARTIRRMATNPAYIGLTYYGMTAGSRKTKLIQQPV